MAGPVRTVCVVGSGGREHALAVVLGRTADVVVTPGNPGITGTTLEGHTITSVDTPAEEIEADLFVIGPEAPLVDGLADRLRSSGRLVFGPGAEGARLEGSKAFMKEMLAEADVDAKLSGDAFGEAGRRVVVEEGLVGPECSLLVLCDGERLAALAPAQDFKRRDDHDDGPNTGGMGAYSPVPSVDDAMVRRLVDSAVAPLVAALRSRGIEYRGVLYAGLMLTPDGPKVLEFNVRFGDPETQVLLPRYEGDLAALLAEAASGALITVPRFAPDAAVCVVLASEGYPDAPRTGDVITGLGDAAAVEGVTVFHAGTALATGAPEGTLVTAGGRVLGVTALGPTIADARRRAYRAVDAIDWPGMHLRSDIALSATAGPAPDGSGASTPAAKEEVSQ